MKTLTFFYYIILILLIFLIIIDSSNNTPLELGLITFEPSVITSNLALPNAFGRIMQGGYNTIKSTHLRDRCKRPTPTYKDNYNPVNAPPEDLATSYSLYVFGKPLFNNCLVIIIRLLIAYIIAPGYQEKYYGIWNASRISRGGGQLGWRASKMRFYYI